MNLGILYSEGKGLPRDDVEAYAWANIASIGGDEANKKRRDEMAQKLTPTPEKLLKAQQRSKELLAEIEKKNTEKK
jgi:TPR repeat protein